MIDYESSLPDSISTTSGETPIQSSVALELPILQRYSLREMTQTLGLTMVAACLGMIAGGTAFREASSYLLNISLPSTIGPQLLSSREWIVVAAASAGGTIGGFGGIEGFHFLRNRFSRRLRETASVA